MTTRVFSVDLSELIRFTDHSFLPKVRDFLENHGADFRLDEYVFMCGDVDVAGGTFLALVLDMRSHELFSLSVDQPASFGPTMSETVRSSVSLATVASLFTNHSQEIDFDRVRPCLREVAGTSDTGLGTDTDIVAELLRAIAAALPTCTTQEGAARLNAAAAALAGRA